MRFGMKSSDGMGLGLGRINGFWLYRILDTFTIFLCYTIRPTFLLRSFGSSDLRIFGSSDGLPRCLETATGGGNILGYWEVGWSVLFAKVSKALG
jgi:hypothetical protein